jgi:dihydroflavonol-4-reductase
LYRKVVITGISGLLGSKLADAYLLQGYEVFGIKRKGTKIPDLDTRIKIFEGDITDTILLEDVFQDSDLVIHTAAVVSFDRRDKEIMFETNVIGTKAVVDTCLVLKVPKLIHISSVAALGRKTTGGLIDENAQWENSEFNTNYAYSKYLSEIEFWRGIEEGLEGFCVNPSIILGCGDLYSTSNKLFQNLFTKYIPYFKGSINVVDLRDVVASIVELDNNKINAERFILNGDSISIKDLMSYFSDRTKAKLLEVPKFIVWVAWFFEGLATFFNGKRSRLTRETFKVMKAESNYSNDKILNVISHKFKTIDETLKYCIAYYVEKYS